MCAQPSLKKSEASSSSLKTEADAGLHDMKEEDRVEEAEPATSSTLREKENTAMSKLVKDMGL